MATIQASFANAAEFFNSLLGGFTILSTLAFFQLKRGDGGNVSQQKDLHLG
jgi:hypothetical protein